MVGALPPGAIKSAVTGIETSTPREACKVRFAGFVRNLCGSGLDVPGNVDQDDSLAAMQQ
jgi:hypothetical protein